MKIINAIHAQSIGGVDQMFRNYCEILAKDGHEVYLLISDNKNISYEIPKVKKIFKLKNISQIFDFIHLLSILYRVRPDVVLCHSNRIMKWMKIMKFFTKTKSVAINHGISFKASLNCDYVVSINQEITDLVIAAGFDKSRCFTLSNVIKVGENYKEKILKKDRAVIGIYGRIEPRKGFDILIRACELLAKKGYDFCLKIGGFEVPGSYNLQTLIDLSKSCNIYEKCKFVGVVKDKKSFFEDVDIFCVPSREEPFGLVILEGFSYSTFVISSDTDGGKTLIKNGENGALFQNENYEDLSGKLEKVINGEIDYQTNVKKAFELLQNSYSFDSFSRKIKEILSKIRQQK